MSFLSIPSQEGLLFKTVRNGRAAEEGNSDEDDSEDQENVRLIPRSSPIPRRRGASIYDETIEYMRIQQAGLIKRSVSFADTTGGDLVEVKEFYQFDSDDEDADAKWEKEEARYRKLQQEPTYTVKPEFIAKSGADLEEAVMKNKVEVELLSPDENEPLAFNGIIQVLNVSFNKAVYIRSTMDNWASYFDYPADYVQGSHEANSNTDKFSFKLSFAPPYNTHGSRIEFVVRYETSDGDYWANNSHCNYVVTLLLSYDDNSSQDKSDLREIRGILRPPKDYSTDDFDFEINRNRDDDEVFTDLPGPSSSDDSRTNPMIPICPIVVPPPEIDIETDTSSRSRLPHHPEPPSVDGTPSTTAVSLGEQKSPCVSSETTSHPSDDEFSVIYQASEPIQPNESGHLHKPQSELFNKTSEQLKDTHLCTSPPVSTSDPVHLDECSTHSATEEEIRLSTLSNPQPDSVANPSITEIPAHTHLDQNTAEWSLFPSASEDVKVDAEHVSMETIESLKQVVKDPIAEDRPQLSIITHGPPDSTLHSSEDHSGSDLCECETKDSLQTDMSQPPQEQMLDVESDDQFMSQPPQEQMLDVVVEFDAQFLSQPPQEQMLDVESDDQFLSQPPQEQMLDVESDDQFLSQPPHEQMLDVDAVFEFLSQPPHEQMLDVDVESDAQFLRSEDSGPQTEPMEALDISLASGDTLLPSAADTLPTATVTLDERPPCASSTTTQQTTDEEPSTVTQIRKPTETPEPSLTLEVSTVLESDEQPDDVMNLESEEEEHVSPVQYKKPPTVPGCISEVPLFLHVGKDEVALRHRAAWHEEKTPSTIFFPAAESQVPPASEAEREKEDSHQDSPEILEEAAKPLNLQPVCGRRWRKWIPSLVFLGAAGLLAVLYPSIPVLPLFSWDFF